MSPDAMYSTTLSYLADICVVVEHQEHAKTISSMLAPYEHLTITAGATTVCIGAARVDWAALQGCWATGTRLKRCLKQPSKSMNA